jgi:hypothetical protein
MVSAESGLRPDRARLQARVQPEDASHLLTSRGGAGTRDHRPADPLRHPARPELTAPPGIRVMWSSCSVRTDHFRATRSYSSEGTVGLDRRCGILRPMDLLGASRANPARGGRTAQSRGTPGAIVGLRAGDRSHRRSYSCLDAEHRPSGRSATTRQADDAELPRT